MCLKNGMHLRAERIHETRNFWRDLPHEIVKRYLTGPDFELIERKGGQRIEHPFAALSVRRLNVQLTHNSLPWHTLYFVSKKKCF